jgi:hypothetical protein
MPMRRVETPKWAFEKCSHPDHEPPNMIVIPAGEVWEHECPACHKKTLMAGSSATLTL